MRYSRVIYVVLTFLFLLTSVSAAVDTVVIQLNSQNYDYSVIGRTYDLYVAGSDLQDISSSQLNLISNAGNVSHYSFTPGNIAGTRTFGTGENSFNVSVLSEADELADSIGSIVVNVDDHSSSVKINDLNLDGRIIRNFNFNSDEFHGLIDLSNFLNGFTFDLGFVKNQNYPTYNRLLIDGGSSAGTVVGSVLIFNSLGFDVNAVNNNPSLLNQVIDAYNANIVYGFNAQAVKSGKDFSFSSDEGYADLNGTYLQNLQDIINEKIKFINPDEVVDVLLPIGNFSEFKQFVDFDVSVNSSNLKMEDGTYNLTLLYTDKFGNQGEMPFKVVLDVTNTGSPESVNSNGTVTFTNIVISQTLQRIENLPLGVNLTAVLYGSNTPSGFVSAPSNVQSLNYINISSNDSSITGSFNLYFKIARTSIPSSAKNDVRLYVQEGSSWIQLSTTLIDETSTNYEYKAVIPHFSNFLIGYVVQSSGGGGGNKAQIYQFGGTNNDSEGSVLPGPINIGGAPSPEDSPGFFAGITGAVIGALGTPGGIVAVIFIVGIVALMIVLRTGRRVKKEKRKKLNERGDKVEEP